MSTCNAKNISPSTLVGKGESSSGSFLLLELEATEDVDSIETGLRYWELSITMAEGEERFDNMFGEDFIEYGSRGDPELLLFILIIITPPSTIPYSALI